MQAHAQTTINLADQCNCEVFTSATEVTEGATTPNGASTGNLLVDPSGDTFYWDGDSWEAIAGTGTRDNHLGDFNQTLSANRSVSLNDNTLFFNGDGYGADADAVRFERSYLAVGGIESAVSHKTIYGLDNGLALDGANFPPQAVAGGTGAFATPGLFIHSNDDVGIGTITPEAKLHVAGDARIETLPAGANTDNIVTADADGNLRERAVADVVTDGLNNGANTGDNHLGDFSQTLSGNRGVNLNDNRISFVGDDYGPNADQINITRSYLNINSIEGPGLGSSTIYSVAGGLALDGQGYGKQAVAGSSGATSTPSLFVESGTDQVGIGTITPNARLHVVGDGLANNWQTTSDARLKKNVSAIENGLDKVMALHPVGYDKKSAIDGDFDKNTVYEYGFIAQEVQEILPKIVITADDEHGSLSVKYDAIIPILTKAIQEQQAEIEALKAQNATLSAQTAELDHLKSEMASIKAMLCNTAEGAASDED